MAIDCGYKTLDEEKEREKEREYEEKKNVVVLEGGMERKDRRQKIRLK